MTAPGLANVVNAIGGDDDDAVPITKFGAKGDGETDDSKALVEAGASGELVRLVRRSRYVIKRAIDVLTPTDKTVGFIGPRSAEVYLDPAAFNNTNADINHRYGDNAYGFRVDNGGVAANTTSRVIFRGFTIIGGAGDATTDGRVVGGIFLRNVAWSDLEHLDIWGFPVGKGVCMTACYGGGVSHSKIHDFYENTLYGIGGGAFQLTGIEVDNDIIAGNTIGSKGLRFIDNDIYNIIIGAEFLASDGNQTDGINLCSKASLDVDSGHFTVSHNRIRNVGEGVDCFADNCIISHNEFGNIFTEAIKLPHGASFNKVVGNDINGAGLCGIGLGSSDQNGDVEGNVVIGNTIQNISPTGPIKDYWDASGFAAATACIFNVKIGANNIKNNMFAHNILRPGNGKWVYNRAATATGTNNNFFYDDYSAGVSGVDASTTETGLIIQIGTLAFPQSAVAWTPAIGATGTAPTGATYSVQSAFYLKDGQNVRVWGSLIATSKGTGGTSNATITGFPLTALGASTVNPQRASGYTPTANAQLGGTFSGSTLALEERVGATITPLTWANVSDTFAFLFDFNIMTAS